MVNYFNYNGKLYKEGSSIIGADNRGLRFGDGIFDTMKYSKGRLILADEHFARLWNGMQVLQFDMPKHFTPDTLQKEIFALIHKNGLYHSVRVRITIFRGNGGLYDPANHIPQYIIQAWELPDSNGEWNTNGLVIGIFEDVKKSCDILSNIKNNNYLPYIMAALFAKKQKWNDAIILNANGRVCDSTIANIFLIRGNKISTPALTEGCVSGVLRKHIIRSKAELNFSVIEEQITAETLLDADEVFLTNSIYNIRWVKRIGNKEYGNNITRKIYDAIVPTIS